MASARNILIGLVHAGAASMFSGDDDARRDWQEKETGKRSCSAMTDAGLQHLVDVLRKQGHLKPSRYKSRITPADERGDFLRKIRAQLATAKRQDSYADGIARKMFGIDRYEWCAPEQLSKIVIALTYDAKRHGRKTR